MTIVKHSTPLSIDSTSHTRIDALWDAVEVLRERIDALEHELSFFQDDTMGLLVKMNVKINELLNSHYTNKQSEEHNATDKTNN
tara:strand:- start:973 stop:1224 length:252 start_codon:yes stop_codon:yes gene_type:complete